MTMYLKDTSDYRLILCHLFQGPWFKYLGKNVCIEHVGFFLLFPEPSCIMAVTKHSVRIAVGIINNIEMAQSTRKSAW